MKAIDAIWFTEMGSTDPIGIVLVEDELTGEKKAYIGKSQGFGGEECDIRTITSTGAKFHVFTAAHLLHHLEGGGGKEK